MSEQEEYKSLRDVKDNNTSQIEKEDNLKGFFFIKIVI
jgi:hypothetical protein